MIASPGTAAHGATLARHLANRTPRSTPRDVFGGIDDDAWLWVFTEGYSRHVQVRSLLPAMPSPRVQAQLTGLEGDVALADGFRVYRLILSAASAHLRRPLTSVLDFGCGWGRILRFFLRDLDPENVWGIDCVPEMIDLCARADRWSHYEVVAPLPPTSLPAERFDLIFSYSVFSHLSEAAHLAWLHELHRVLRPGGILVASTREREFILHCAALRAQQETREFAQGARTAFPDTADSLSRYDRGEFVHEPTGGGFVLDASFFGETCIPRSYVERVWSELFTILDYLDDRSSGLQNVVIAKK